MKRWVRFLEDKQLLLPTQFGFTDRSSCTANLVQISQEQWKLWKKNYILEFKGHF